MSAPAINSFCCGGKENDVPFYIIEQFKTVPFNITCLISSIISIGGCIYQILPRRNAHLISEVYSRQYNLIIALAIADLLASFGILFRSVSWLVKEQVYDLQWNNGYSGSLLCVITASWVQYFYNVTYFLNLCYAIDVYKIVHDHPKITEYYITLSFLLASIFTALAMTVLYYPNLKCTTNFVTIAIINVTTYLPMVLVMVINPILYILTSHEVKTIILTSSGRWTNHERHLHYKVIHKFLKILSVFYICWLPNIIALVLISKGAASTQKLTIGLLYITAIINPQQALLNAFVYIDAQKATNIICYSCCEKASIKDVGFGLDLYDFKYIDTADEIHPLLNSTSQ